MINWRTILLLTIPLRFWLASQDSYIHPDEHFQSMSWMSNKVFGYASDIPWEFQDPPSRSLSVLYLFYFPVFWISRKFELSPYVTYSLSKLQFCIIQWIVVDWCLYRIMPIKQERVKAILYTSINYVSLVYQSHTFSNSIETWLVLFSLVIITKYREWLETDTSTKQKYPLSKSMAVSLGLIFAIGFFNRITFPCWFIFSGIFALNAFVCSPIQFTVFMISVLAALVALRIGDEFLFRGSQTSIVSMFNGWSSLRQTLYTAAPVRNLVYNLNGENLKLHGEHPWFTHLLINMPLMLGPIIVLILLPTSRYRSTLPFLTLAGGLISLSLMGHQELRFLMPVVPLGSCCVDISAFSLGKRALKLILRVTVLFNLIMCGIMGVLHQGGVVPILKHIQETVPDSTDPLVTVWWRTYKPPEYLLGKSELTVLESGSDLSGLKGDALIDLMGCVASELEKTMQDLASLQHTPKIMLTLPDSSSHLLSDDLRGRLTSVYRYSYHLDMDHIDLWGDRLLGITLYSFNY